jgi:hypothetical protein
VRSLPYPYGNKVVLRQACLAEAARVDGKSPGGHLISEAHKGLVRRMAKEILGGGVASFSAMLEYWTEALATRQI